MSSAALKAFLRRETVTLTLGAGIISRPCEATLQARQNNNIVSMKIGRIKITGNVEGVGEGRD
jgi:hypothetical protein